MFMITNYNRSSRSHSVFTLHLSAINESQGANLKGTLSLVDLAGKSYCFVFSMKCL